MNQREVLSKKSKMAEFRQRQTAYKLRIGDLIRGEYFAREGLEPNYIKIGEKEISRVNIIATVVNDFSNEEGSYSTITLDDGSGNIQIRAWKEDVNLISNIKLGDIVMIIGKPKSYNDQIYLIPEIIKKLDNPLWIKLRNLELGKSEPIEKEVTKKVNSYLQVEQTASVVEEMIEEGDNSQNSRQKILNTIENLDFKEGAELSEVIKVSGVKEKEAMAMIDELLKEGEIYQIKAGRLKILE